MRTKFNSIHLEPFNQDSTRLWTMDESSINLLHSPWTKEVHGSCDASLDSTGFEAEEHFRDAQAEAKGLKRSRSMSYLYIGLLTIIEALAFIAYTRFSRTDASSPRLPTSTTWKHCGNTSEQAIANNCVLDFIAGAWVPTQCYDPELEAEFFNIKNWHWYADSDGEQELSIESIRKDGGPNPIYVSVEYHWVHCAYTWRKLHRARMLQRPIDTHVGDYEHTV
ncbi:uncharacterized protein PAC_09351 [Phialocephala subalpina]|uniref:Uncharacterized protein n=1 Tax=Phialocephala subalpina TaxID=576137 RepID=A0A1L7X354_9HELO|nr:uncharacterized protein PAC_09351 [Phialocephala subalpina]